MTLAADELRDIIKGPVDGVLAFIDSECVAVEQRYREILTSEAKLFGDDGRLIPEIREARDEIRKKSAKAGYWTMFSPESIGGSELPPPVSGHLLEALYLMHGAGHL